MSIESESGPEIIYPPADNSPIFEDNVHHNGVSSDESDDGRGRYPIDNDLLPSEEPYDSSPSSDRYVGPDFLPPDDDELEEVSHWDEPEAVTPKAVDRPPEATDKPRPQRETIRNHVEQDVRWAAAELRVKALLEPKEDGAYPTSDRPTADVVATAARNGRTSRVVITRGVHGGPVALDTTPDMLPPGAEAVDLRNYSDNPAEQPDNPDDFVGAPPKNLADMTPSEEFRDRFPCWVRLEEHRRAPDAKSGGEKKQPDPKTDRTFDMGGLLAKHKGAFQAVYEGEGVPDDKFEALGSRLNRNMHDAEDNDSFHGMVRKQQLGLVEEDFKGAVTSGLMKRTVYVGATSPEDLREIAETFAAEVLSTEHSTWRVAADSANAWYGSIDQARARAKAPEAENLESYVSPERFADDVRYPTRNEVYGIPKDRQFNLGAGNRDIPEGAHCVTIGEYEDDYGNKHPAKVPLDSLLEHTIMPGASGSGKTVTLEMLTAEVIAEGWRRHLADPSIPPVKVVAFSARKRGDITKNVADMLAGMPDMPDHLKQVYVIRPGEGYRPTVNIHGSAIQLAARVLDKMGILRKMGIGVKRSMQGAKISFSAGNSGDAESTRVNERYFMDGLIWANENLGADTVNDRSKYTYDVPAKPTNRFLAWCVREKLREGGYEAKVQGNVGEYVAGPLEMHPHTIAGDAFHGGPNVDYRKVLKNSALTTEELEAMGTDAVSRKIAMMAKMDALEMAVRQELEEARVDTDAEGNYNVKHLRLLVEFDEAFDLFDESVTGDIMGDYLTRLRSMGVGIIIAQQGGFKKMNPRVIKNTQTVVALKTSDPEDLDVLAERLVIERPNAEFIARQRLKRGQGLMAGPGLEATRFRTTNPDNVEKREGRLGDVGDLLDFDVYKEFFTNEELKEISLAEVEEFVTQDPTGMRISMHAQMNAALVASGRLPQRFGKGTKLPNGTVVPSNIVRGIAREKAKNPNDTRHLLLRAAAVMSAKSAVDGRPDIMWETTRARAAEYHAKHLIAQIMGDELPEELTPPRDMVLNFGEYSIVEDQVVERLTARPIKLPENLKAVIRGDSDNPQITGELPGNTASEQLDVVRHKESESVDRIVSAIKAGNATPQAARELGRLLNGAMPKEAKETEAARMRAAQEHRLLTEIQQMLGYNTLVQEGEGIDHVRSTVESRLQHPLNEEETKVFQKLLDMKPDDEVGYPTVRSMLTHIIKTQYSQAVRVDLSVYAEQVYPGQTFVGVNARKQLEDIKKKAAAFLEASHYTADEANLFFAYDTLQGATATDRFIAGVMSRSGPQGVIFKEQARENSEPGSDKALFAHLLRIGNKRAVAQWKKILTAEILYGRENDRSLAATRYLVSKIMEYTQILQQRAAESKEMAASNARAMQGRR